VLCAGLIAAFVLATGGKPAAAQTPEQFYQGKQLSMIIGFNVGGTYDTYGRLVSTYLPHYLSGRPAVIPRNMAGAGSFKAASYIFNQAPRDGTVIGMVNEGLLLDQLFSAPNMDFDVGRFNWVGRINSATNIGVVWHTAPAKTIEEIRTTDLITGSTGIQSMSGGLARIMNTVLGTKFKIIAGYGSARALALALERGEIQAYFTDATEVLTVHRDWLSAKKVSVPVQFTEKRNPALSETPTILELARNADERQILAFPASVSVVGKSFFAPPGVPADRLAALRNAFTAMVRDPRFIAEVQQRSIALDPLAGDLVQARVKETLAAPPALAARAAQLWKP
jgi:tripartite-type tricarboxylate transporter receptor subunit TctC